MASSLAQPIDRGAGPGVAGWGESGLSVGGAVGGGDGSDGGLGVTGEEQGERGGEREQAREVAVLHRAGEEVRVVVAVESVESEAGGVDGGGVGESPGVGESGGGEVARAGGGDEEHALRAVVVVAQEARVEVAAADAVDRAAFARDVPRPRPVAEFDGLAARNVAEAEAMLRARLTAVVNSR